MIPCRLSHLVIDETNDQQKVHLMEMHGHRRVGIAIGMQEALAIDRGLKKLTFPRPLTHDFLIDILRQSGNQLLGVRIVECREGVFYAEIDVRRLDGASAQIPCRPSDALAMWVRWPDLPLFVAEDILAMAEDDEAAP